MIFYLLSVEHSVDSIGQYVETVTERPVFGNVQSVTASEFFAGGQNGFKPEYRITMFGPDYEGEENLKLNGVIYSIYRTYRAKTDEIELYVEKRAGDKPAEEKPAEEKDDENDGGQS